MKDFLTLFYHDMRLEMRQPGEWIVLVLFFIVLILLLPFAIGPDPDLLQRLAPGLIWLAALLMSLLALDRLFIADARDGTLDLMLLSPLPLAASVTSKLFAHIFMMLMVLVMMLGPALLMLNVSLVVAPILVISLLLGVPVMVFLGGMIGALTVQLPRSHGLLTLLLVPFYIPVLVFAVGACEAAFAGDSSLPNILLLSALLALLLPTAPFIIAGALRHTQG